MGSRRPRSPALLRRTTTHRERADWSFELTPHRLHCWSTERSRSPLYAQPESKPLGRAARILFLLVLAVGLMAGTIAWLGRASWPDGLTGRPVTLLEAFLLLIGVLCLTAVVAIGGGALLLAVSRSGIELEIDTTTSRWHCSDSRLLLGTSTATGPLDDLLYVSILYYSESWKDLYWVMLTFKRGARTRKVTFHCDMTEDLMTRHRRWLLDRLGPERVPSPRPCQPDT
jgi:hypothetical protein